VKITFLGTGTSQGVPIIACQCPICLSKNPKDNRLRSSLLIQTHNGNLVIDSGPDFRQQMLRQKVTDLRALLFTHGHKDHTAGMDDIRAFNYILQKPIDIYADKATIQVLKKDFDYAFSDKKYPGVPELEIHEIINQPFCIDQTVITPIEVLHYKLPVYGFRINDFTYITDANYISDTEKNKIKGSRILVLNALRKEPHISHFSLSEAITLAQEIGAEQTYFTHISHQLGLHEEVQSQLPENIYLAYDGLTIEIN
jgi:phosphoribosyl 1,2-cyclic phosphate phosphodiesterase